MKKSALPAHFDGRSYFERTLAYGIDHGIVTRERLAHIEEFGAKGIIQIAGYFGTDHLRKDLDEALVRMVYLVSLFLESQSHGNLQMASSVLMTHSFMSLSKAGSDMLRTLHAKGLAEHSLSASDQDVRDFLNYYTLKSQLSLKSYEQRLLLHDEQIIACDCALWFGRAMGLDSEIIEENDAASIVRSCLFTRAVGSIEEPRWHGPLLTSQEFLQAIARLRKERWTKARGRWTENLYADVPDEYVDFVTSIFDDMKVHDVRRITGNTGSNESQNQLLDYLAALYFRRQTELSDNHDDGSLVSEHWQKITQGRSDDDSMNTLLMCAAAEQKPQVEISQTIAKTIIKTMRQYGVNEKLVIRFIEEDAPLALQKDLLRQWEHELLPDLRTYVLIEADTQMERALRFVGDHACLKRKKTS
jgi:hypothetical protein